MEYHTKLELNPQHCAITLFGGSPLTEMAFGIETAISHFLGRKVARFECKRSKLDNGDCRLDFTALKQSGPMVISKVMNIRNAANEGFYPKVILDSECFLNEPGFSSLVEDGQHRHQGFVSKSDANMTTTVVESDANPNTSLALISYGLGDMFTGLFALNVRYVKWQGSLTKTQLYIKHNISEQKLTQYLTASQDYDVARKIKTLV